MALNDNLANLKKLLSALDEDHMGKEEFANHLELVVKRITQIAEQNSKAIDDLEKTYALIVQKVDGNQQKGLNDLRGQVDKLFIGDRMSKVEQGHADAMDRLESRLEALSRKVDQKLATVRNGRDGIDGRSAKDVDEQALIKKILAQIPKPKDGKDGGSFRASNSTGFSDLSSQTNGSLKVFSVPKGLAGVIFSSDFPNVLMEGNGFTINSSRTEITLTTESAPSQNSQLLYQFVKIFN